jgi:hypothetical protein
VRVILLGAAQNISAQFLDLMGKARFHQRVDGAIDGRRRHDAAALQLQPPQKPIGDNRPFGLAHGAFTVPPTVANEVHRQFARLAVEPHVFRHSLLQC